MSLKFLVKKKVMKVNLMMNMKFFKMEMKKKIILKLLKKKNKMI